MREVPFSLRTLAQRVARRLYSSTARQGAVMFGALTLVGATNYAYHVLMGRLLGPGEYATFASLLAVFAVLAVPSQVVQTVTAYYTAKFIAVGDWSRIRTHLISTLKLVSLGSLVAAILTIAASGAISDFLQISDPVPAAVMGAMIVPSVLLYVTFGALQGLQKFGFLGAGMMGNGLLRLVAGVILVLLGLKAGGSLGAGFISAALIFLITLVPLWHIFRKTKKSSSQGSQAVPSYSFWATLGLASFALMTNMDMIAVKHFFPPEEAGQYAAGATLGKVVLFLPAAIAMVMFPKSTQEHALGGSTAHILRKSLLAVALVLSPVILAYWLVPGLVVGVVFGSAFAPAIPIVGGIGLAMGLFALLNVLLLYYLSIQRWAFVKLLVAGTVAQGVSLALFHSSLNQVIMVLILNGAILIALGELVCRSAAKRGSVIPLTPEQSPQQASKGF